MVLDVEVGEVDAPVVDGACNGFGWKPIAEAEDGCHCRIIIIDTIEIFDNWTK